MGLLGQLAHHRTEAGALLPVDEIVGHLLLLFWAGYDTTASAGAPATIQSVAIVGGDTVQITVSDTISTLNSSVGYAFTANSTPAPGGTFRWGQLRDSDPFVGSTSGVAQPNYGVAFQQSIP